MVRRPPSRSSVLIAITLLVAFAVWTWLTFNSPALAAFDARTLPPPVDPTSRTAEIISAFALLTWPGFEYAALAGIALWAIRHRLRQLDSTYSLVEAEPNPDTICEAIRDCRVDVHAQPLSMAAVASIMSELLIGDIRKGRLRQILAGHP